MELGYIDQFITDFIIAIHLLVLMFGLVYISGRLWSYFLNKIFEFEMTPAQKKLKIQINKKYADF